MPGSEVAGLPAAPGVDVGADVTIERLLTHTSGLPDFFEPPRGSGSAASITGAVSDPDRRWTPSALLDEARAMPAVGRPGERFHYCDTGFVVLGRVVEEVTGDPFNTVLRQQVLEPAGMARSSTPYGDAVAPGELAGLEVAPFWIGRRELSRALCVSLDWAGGGIVGPPEDFVAFQQALHSGQLISPTLLAHLARPRRRRRPGLHYGAGLVTIRFHEFFPVGLANLPQPVGGVGAFATHMFHYPQQQAHVVINFHGTQQMQASFQTHCRIAMVLRGLTIDAPIGDQLFTPVPSPQ
ncbi:serine hydrolase domain-containing protein [Microlunatus sp. Y2014]|uniref:serine hydrolase domain-containing protein n=1 Tax=Microlunatus sp. Y2014 TaxID=3418488 RepID=UPI003DA6D11E